ncbi:hypothetical protein P22_1446 [Propionispora sp. 2/2-37]|nr:hypothetical protein P22_1446 [Propionispora sp. 2/2-37]
MFFGGDNSSLASQIRSMLKVAPNTKIPANFYLKLAGILF